MLRRTFFNVLAFVAITLLLVSSFVSADEKSHRYAPGENVQLWVNQVGPHYNPQETYGYYTLPFCKPDKIKKKFPSIGEALQGIELTKSDIVLKFKENMKTTVICSKTITEEIAKKFEYAVKHQYWYQFYIDELPMWALVGGVVNEGHTRVPFIYTHQAFSIGYNDDRIVEVNLTAINPVPLTVGDPLEFTYSVDWVPSETKFEKRFRRYLDYHFFEHKIHWFSIFNSFMMVLFLSGLVFMILMRTLKSDYAKYSKEVEDGYDSDKEFSDDSGWKQVHGDVFRPPNHLEFFSALIGTGWQIVIMVFFLIFFATAGSIYDTPGSMTTHLIVSYALTTFAAGFFSGSHYSRSGGKKWIKTMIITASFFPGVCCSVAFLLNWVAIAYKSLAAVPFLTMIAMAAIWALISAPLVLAGTIVGKNFFGKVSNPCRTNPMPRFIPPNPWYKSRAMFIAAGGLLPFGSIFIEMYFIFTSFWNYKYYYVYGFMFLVFIILIIVTMCVAIASTYFLLNAEDYRWPWTSFLSSASTAVYVYLYAIYFFHAKTSMSGFFQVSFYFGYMALFCFALGLMCGTIGYVGTEIFVRRIYRNLHVD